MAKWLSLQKTDTGFIFATTNSAPLSSRWEWLSNAIAHEFECDADDLDFLEDDDGREFVTLRGAAIVQIHDCRMVNEARPLVQLDRVA